MRRFIITCCANDSLDEMYFLGGDRQWLQGGMRYAKYFDDYDQAKTLVDSIEFFKIIQPMVDLFTSKIVFVQIKEVKFETMFVTKFSMVKEDIVEI